MTSDPKILSSHALYVKLAGEAYAVMIDYGRERVWFEWLKRFKDEDLRIVIGYLHREIKAKRRNPGALKFNNLIGQLDFFEEDLLMARAATRNYRPPPTTRQAALHAVGRREPEVEEIKTPASVLANGYEALRKQLEGI